VYTSETPAGTSVKNMAHWSQGVTTDAFQMYDYGTSGNMQHYGQAVRTVYPVLPPAKRLLSSFPASPPPPVPLPLREHPTCSSPCRPCCFGCAVAALPMPS
jgi:hypothetical protein